MSNNGTTDTGVVVVGVDGSAPSRRALQFAAADARRRHTRLLVVAAYDSSNDAFLVSFGGPSISASSRRASVEKMARELLAETLGENGDLDVTVEIQEGPAARVLLELSAGADLLVIGSRGHGGFRGLVLGSVSAQCVHHATCPVTVVHAEPSPPREHLAGRHFEAQSMGPLY